MKSISGISILLFLAVSLMFSPKQSHAKAIISGRVYVSSTVGVPNVLVSDGFSIVQTDENGEYAFESDKKSGIVYISMPSGYMMYENYKTTDTEKIFPPYWHAFNYPNTKNKNEEHNFRLKAVNNTNHIMCFIADAQLCGRQTKDLELYQTHFIPRIKKEAENAGTTPIYSIHLGDEVFDEYWYQYKFNPSTFKAKQTGDGYPMKIFPTMGNHDNDGATPQSDSVDYEAARPYRMALGPEYYSMNIGSIHYVFLDNIVYKNTYTPTASYNTGILGDRDYDTYVTESQMEWLKKDLSYVDKSTPVFLCLHAPLWGVNSKGATYALRARNAGGGTYQICDALKDFEKVEIFSGHRHKYYNCTPSTYPNIYEHTVGCVGGNLYWAGKYSGHVNCSDGAPGGYLVLNIKDKDYEWIWENAEPGEYGTQFRVIDVNTWRQLYNTDPTYAKLPATGHAYNNPNTEFADNTVLLNVFAYDPAWKIEVTENGIKKEVKQCFTQDVYHIITCDIPRRLASTTISDEMASWATHHMFKVVASSPTSTLDIKVTDRFGNVFSRTVTLPIPCTADALQPKNDVQMNVSGIRQAAIVGETATIYTQGSAICVDADKKGQVSIVSLSGETMVKTLNEGHNVFNVNGRGIYIVRANGIIKKLFIK